MIAFIDDHQGAHGVEPICKVLPIAPSTCYDHLAKRADAAHRSDRARRDEVLRPEIERVFGANYRVYGARKAWHQMRREDFVVARCTVARLMKSMEIQRIIRGKPHRTTVPDRSAPCPQGKVNRRFRVPAPDMLWVGDSTYVATCQSAWNRDPRLEWAPGAGRGQAAVLTGGRVCWFSNCSGLR